MIHRDGNMLEMNIKINVYSKPNKKGDQKLLKKNVILKKCVDIDRISGVEQTITTRGNVKKGECVIVLDNEEVLVQHSYDELIKCKAPIQIKGFRYDNSNKKRKKSNKRKSNSKNTTNKGK